MSSVFMDLVNLTVLSRCRFVDFNSDKIICCQRSYIEEFFILRIVSTTKSLTIGVQGTLMKEWYFVLSLLIDILRWGIFEYIFLIIPCMNAFISVHIKKMLICLFFVIHIFVIMILLLFK